MGVNQTRKNDTPTAIHDLTCGIRGRNLIGWPDSLNVLLANGNRARVEEVKITIHRSDTAASQNHVNIGHNPSSSIPAVDLN